METGLLAILALGIAFDESVTVHLDERSLYGWISGYYTLDPVVDVLLYNPRVLLLHNAFDLQLFDCPEVHVSLDVSSRCNGIISLHRDGIILLPILVKPEDESRHEFLQKRSLHRILIRLLEVLVAQKFPRRRVRDS